MYGLYTREIHEAWIMQQALNARRAGTPNDPLIIKRMSDTAPRATPAIARVNISRWLADCPNGDGGCLMVEFGHPFMCPYCCNADIGGQWRKVSWPSARGLIERILMRRPVPANRNWTPGESLEQLRAENRAHDLDAGD